jgi:hypothetical protein
MFKSAFCRGVFAAGGYTEAVPRRSLAVRYHLDEERYSRE